MEKIRYEDLEGLEYAYGDAYKLRLRPINEDDTDNIVKWRNNLTVQSQFIFREPFTHEMHKQWLEHKVYKGLVIQYIIEIEEHPIGSVYIRDIDNYNESGEFGIFIGEEKYIGKGIGSVTTELFISYCFRLGFHRIFLRVLDTNSIAKRCYLNANFVFEGTARDMVCINGIRHDVTFMSIIAK